MKWNVLIPAALAVCSLMAMADLAQAADAPAAYKEHCASCHGEARLGGIGPALIPENLARLRKAEAEKVIREGRPATQMPAFGDKLNAEEIKAMIEYAYAPIKPMPAWGEKEITASRIVLEPKPLPDKPVFKADPQNLFVVVESGDHHVSILDGDKLEPIHRFQSRFALHGGPKFTPDGRYVFFASRDGWITKFDLWNLTVISEVRAGINTRNAAVSGDGKYVAVANYLPHSLVILDADLNFVKSLAVSDKDGKVSSRVSAVYDASPRQSFVAALKDVKEVWEVSYNPKADDSPAGMIHDFKYKEGAFLPGFLNPVRTQLDDYLDEMIVARSADLTDDVLSDLIRAEDDGDKLTHDEVLMMASGLLMAGTDTTRNQVAAADRIVPVVQRDFQNFRQVKISGQDVGFRTESAGLHAAAGAAKSRVRQAFAGV